MKKLLAIFAALMMGNAIAQDTGGRTNVQEAAPGVKHMFDFKVDSMMNAMFALDRSKVGGTSASNDSRAMLNLNYAYGIHSYLQTGFRFNYTNGVFGTADQEIVDVAVGAILNSQEDFSRAMYASLYVGTGYAQNFGRGTRDGIHHATLAIGKRFRLDRFNIKHVVYSPEIAFNSTNSRDNESLDYSQSMQFRLLQFSVLF
jgi:hypothetical protein